MGVQNEIENPKNYYFVLKKAPPLYVVIFYMYTYQCTITYRIQDTPYSLNSMNILSIHRQFKDHPNWIEKTFQIQNGLILQNCHEQYFHQYLGELFKSKFGLFFYCFFFFFVLKLSLFGWNFQPIWRISFINITISNLTCISMLLFSGADDKKLNKHTQGKSLIYGY